MAQGVLHLEQGDTLMVPRVSPSGTTSCGRGTTAIDLTHLRGCLVEWEGVFEYVFIRFWTEDADVLTSHQ